MAQDSLLDALGVRAGLQVDVLDLPEGFLLEGLQQRGAEVGLGPRRGSDLVFLGAEDRESLAALRILEKIIDPAGAVWVVYPTAGQAVGRGDVVEVAEAVGLAEAGIVSFSEQRTALKLVVHPDRR